MVIGVAKNFAALSISLATSTAARWRLLFYDVMLSPVILIENAVSVGVAAINIMAYGRMRNISVNSGIAKWRSGKACGGVA